MSYSISVKFNNEKETQTMFNFLNEVQPKIKKNLDKSTHIDDQYFYFNTGKDISVYAPSVDKNLYISTHASLITPMMFQLYIWMACLSNAKENNKPFIVLDEDKLVIDDMNTMSKEEIKYNKNILSSNGLHYKNFDNKSTILKTLTYFTGEKKEFNSFNSFLSELTNEFLEYKNKTENKPKKPSI